MFRQIKNAGLGFCAASVSLMTAAAQTNPPAVQTTAASALATTNPAAADWMQKIKQPVPWMNWGGDLRVRNEYFNNLLTLNP